MNAFTVILQTAIYLPPVTWQEAIEPFLNTLDSPQTRRSYRGDIAEAMQRLKIALVGEITASYADHLPRVACGAFGCARRKTVDPFDGGAQVGNSALVFAILPADWSHAPYV